MPTLPLKTDSGIYPMSIACMAMSFSEIVTNTYGWNVMKPTAIDKEMYKRILQYDDDKKKKEAAQPSSPLLDSLEESMISYQG